MKVLAVIPARGGSKGIKGKNLQAINDEPLIAYTIKASLNSKLVTKTIVSTDDEKIAKTAIEYGADVPFMRPIEYATDQAKSIDVVLHALKECSSIYSEDYDLLILLQPTSPFRNAMHIDNAIQMLAGVKNADSLISVKEVSNDINPHYLYEITKNDFCEPMFKQDEIVRRQDLPPCYVRNGAIYAVRTRYLEENRSLIAERNLAFEMDDECSINIDTELDLLIARSIALKNL